MSVAGLDGVVVAETVLSEVDGEAGRLVVRGQRIEELAGSVSFEEMARRLWEGLAPAASSGLDSAAGAPGASSGLDTAAAVQSALGRGRAAVFADAGPLLRAAAEMPPLPPLPPIAALRLGLASLRPDGGADHVLAAAAIPVFVAAFDRARRGLPAVAPDAALGQAADFLRMLRGEPASGAEVSALDAYLVTVAEHGMNASTFTARVVASTRAGVLPAVIAALGALEGPLHGGAPGPVLDMLDALRGTHDVRRWLAAELDAGRRLMGFGHRIYRVRDPRADVLKEQVARLRAAARGGTGDIAGRLALAEVVERAALAALVDFRPQRRIETNVEFYTAVLLDALGIDRSLFTPVFAAGRVAGWTAHVFEQERANRLIRPQSRYVGPRPAPALPAGAPA
jgi:citrate synthase